MMRLISSDDSKSKTLVKEFKENSLPRIAISVGILDTGVDIPEVCNLVFARPTKSIIRFWQMIGRGTRHDSTCENKDWLPIGGKMFFKIFDFMTNFERLVEGNPPEDTSSASPSIINRIINVKLAQYKFVKKGGN
jgi:type I restriction enzyme, R subunit